MDIDLEGKPKRELKTLNAPQRTVKIMVGAVVSAGALAVLMGGLYFWQSTHAPKQMLATAITQQITGYTPYFYLDRVPGGYSVDTANITLAPNLLSVPLIKAGGPTISVTEQPLPAQLSIDDLKKNATEVKGAVATAYINAVEGRLVGIIPVQSTKTMVLLSVPDGLGKDAFTEFIKALRPLR